MCQATSTCDGNGGCTVVNKPDNTQCSDSNACTYGDVCRSGVCSGTGYTCTPSQCQSTSVCDGTGGCLYGNKTNGTGCNDGSDCTWGDSCTNGICGGNPYSCYPTSCQFSSSCDGSGGCTTVNKPDGTNCPDPNGDCCVLGGKQRCTNGECVYPTCCNTDTCCNL
jgi:hypothetical protein